MIGKAKPVKEEIVLLSVLHFKHNAIPSERPSEPGKEPRLIFTKISFQESVLRTRHQTQSEVKRSRQTSKEQTKNLSKTIKARVEDKNLCKIAWKYWKVCLSALPLPLAPAHTAHLGVCSGCSCGSGLETTPREVITDRQTRLSIQQLKNNNNLLKTPIELSKLYSQKSQYDQFFFQTDPRMGGVFMIECQCATAIYPLAFKGMLWQK